MLSQIGELEWKRQDFKIPLFIKSFRHPVANNESPVHITSDALDHDPLTDPDLINYAPKVSKATGEWFVSAIDLAFLAEGVAILGVGTKSIPYITWMKH
jgi:hypothetical protein